MREPRLGMKLQMFHQIAREKGVDYVNSKSRHELCLEMIESGNPARVHTGVRLLIRSPILAMLKGRDTHSDMVGYSLDEFRRRIESTFLDGMSWDNHGKWEIDHIVPVSDFINRRVFDPKVVNALDNLQALWKVDNMSKSNKW